MGAGIPLESMSLPPGNQVEPFVGMGITGQDPGLPSSQDHWETWQHYCGASGNVLGEGQATHSPGSGRGRGAGQRHHLLDGQPELEAVQGIADANLPLDLCVRQG